MSCRFRWSLCWTLFVGLAAPVGAQQPNAVEIHPTNINSVEVAPYSTNTQRFWVVNTGTQANQYALFANVCTPHDLYCEWPNTFLGSIAFGDSVPVDVKFTAGHAGTTGTISFDARINTDQSIRATKNFTVIARQELHLEVAAFNPGSAEERDVCLTVAVATDAAYECGDLRLVHALPSVRARGVVRTPTLLYNSRFAHPFALVTGTFSVLPHDVTNLTATLTVPRPGGDIVVPQGFPDALFTASSVRKFVLGFDASALPTGVYPYTLAVTMSLGGSPVSRSASGTLIVVNWKTSPFGAGWWLAGYERIYTQADSSLLWVGGDGSARHYTSAGAGVYKAFGIDRPDSITIESGNFVRHLRSRARVEFAPNGKHFATTDRLGLVTFFHHDQYGQMVHIDPAGFSSLRYDFAYSSFTGPLETVTAPPVGGAARVVQRYVLPDGRILLHTDPDQTVVEFGFDPVVSERITRRINRRGVAQTFAFDAAGKLVTVRVPLNASDTAVTTFCPAESRGFTSTSCSAGPLHPDSAVTIMDGPRTDATDVTTFCLDRFGALRVIRDPLGNQTQLFRGNRDFPGLVTRVVHANGWVNDAFHDQTGLITKLVQYAPLGPGQDAVTEYAWEPKWERVAQITFPEGNVLSFAYDTGTGNRIWQQLGPDPARRVDFRYHGLGANGALLLATVIYPPDPQGVRARDSVSYDALGNAAEMRRAVGTGSEGVTHLTNDALGRTIRTSVDIIAGGSQQQRDSAEFDVMDRVLRTKAYGFGTTPAETLFTESAYDSEGNRRRLERWSSPDAPGTPVDRIVTRWGYDLADRAVADTAADGNAERRVYDLAGNVVRDTTRRDLARTMTYDALNRLTSRTLPPVTYQRRTDGVLTLPAFASDSNRPYPRYPLSPGDTAVIAGDTETFEYDAVGNMSAALNGDAKVRRTYYANGLLESETLRIRTYAGSDTTTHAYRTEAVYDLNGCRTRVIHPPPLAAGTVTGDTRFEYSAITGALERVRDAMDTTFTYHLDLRGLVDTLYMPGGIKESLAYDAAGQLTTNRIHNNSDSDLRFTIDPLRLTTFTYDRRGKLESSSNSAGAKDVLSAQYTGLGYLRSSNYSDHGTNALGSGLGYTSTESFQYDALGNLFQTSTVTTGAAIGASQRYEGGRGLRYHAGSGRVRAITTASRVDTLHYDAEGNVEFSTFKPPAFETVVEDRASYYDAAARLRAVDHRLARSGGYARFARPARFTFEEFRYDALGRRVLARLRRWCQTDIDPSFDLECDLHTIRRTVWDGDQELYEIQMPGGDTASAATLESDGQAPEQPIVTRFGYFDPNPFFGRVAYAHGEALDQPLSITRLEYADRQPSRPFVRWPAFTLVPHWNARGTADNGAFADGGADRCMNDGINNFRCVRVQWPFGWTAYQQKSYVRITWHGSLVEQKRDGSGMLYRRNRYVDPATGRFTQEDPIGLAGGLNLYGFAAGDPVNFADPFGLCPLAWPCEVIGAAARWATNHPAAAAALADFADNVARGTTVWTGGTCAGPGCRTGAFLGAIGIVSATARLPGNLPAATVEEGIYEFTATSGKVYVGQSGNISQRLLQHVRSGKLAASDMTSVSRTEVLGGKTAREIAEQRRINQLGGIVNLENKVNPIGPARQHLLTPP